MNEQLSLREIIGKYVDGVASTAEISQLNAALKTDAQLRAWYLRYVHLDAALAQSIAATTSAPVKTSYWRNGVMFSIAISLALVLMFAGYFSKPTKQPAAVALASLVAAQDVVWNDPNTELTLQGGQLPAGIVRLNSGTAEFRLNNGATVLLHGPAALEFREKSQLFVESGRIFCRCPTVESRITVITPATEVIDLGTEFSVEARADLSTLVTVLSGEVQVGKELGRVLRSGEAVHVRGDGMLAVKPLDRSEFAELFSASPMVHESLKSERSLVQDSGFELGLNPQTWGGTSGNLQIAPNAGRKGNAVRIHSDGIAQWPQCRQKLDTGDIAGKLVVASVWAAPDQIHLQSRQQAILKLTFVNREGRDFGFALHRFLSPQSPPNRFEKAQVAAIAPPGTERVQMQLMFQTHLQESGAVLFDDASLLIADYNTVQTRNPPSRN